MDELPIQLKPLKLIEQSTPIQSVGLILLYSKLILSTPATGGSLSDRWADVRSSDSNITVCQKKDDY